MRVLHVYGLSSLQLDFFESLSLESLLRHTGQVLVSSITTVTKRLDGTILSCLHINYIKKRTLSLLYEEVI